MLDGKLQSVKVYFMGALGIACFTFLWFGRMSEPTFMGVMTPTFIAWLAAHVTQQLARIKADGAAK